MHSASSLVHTLLPSERCSRPRLRAARLRRFTYSADTQVPTFSLRAATAW